MYALRSRRELAGESADSRENGRDISTPATRIKSAFASSIKTRSWFSVTAPASSGDREERAAPKNRGSHRPGEAEDHPGDEMRRAFGITRIERVATEADRGCAAGPRSSQDPGEKRMMPIVVWTVHRSAYPADAATPWLHGGGRKRLRDRSSDSDWVTMSAMRQRGRPESYRSASEESADKDVGDRVATRRARKRGGVGR